MYLIRGLPSLQKMTVASLRPEERSKRGKSPRGCHVVREYDEIWVAKGSVAGQELTEVYARSPNL